MPKGEDLRAENMKFVRCAICGEYLGSMVPIGVTGDFYHPDCRTKIKEEDSNESNDQSRPFSKAA